MSAVRYRAGGRRSVSTTVELEGAVVVVMVVMVVGLVLSLYPLWWLGEAE